MKRRNLVIIGVIILCISAFLLSRYFNAPGNKINAGQISEKDFNIPVSGSLQSGRDDETGSRRIEVPIRLKITDINNVMGIVTIPDILFKFAVSFITILIILMAIYFIKERIKRPKILSPYERAVKELAVIDLESLCPETVSKELYFLIARIMREYLKDSLTLGAKALTTREFFEKLDEVAAVPDNTRAAIKDIILRCDLIKFSGGMVSIDDFKKDFSAVKELIDAINTVLTPEGDDK